jgi:NAD(P)-dependent dehydrogenase (short-subunit alcohol dehydrogenase family)
MLKTFVSAKLELVESTIQNLGLKHALRAKAPIQQGEILSIRFGEILKKEDIPDYSWKHYYPLSDEYVLGPSKNVADEDQILFLQHSCEPNAGISGEVTQIARRDISIGEEITIDYATIDNDDYSYTCSCGSSTCRGTITGKDWMKPDVQLLNKGWFAKYLQEKIAHAEEKETKTVMVIGASGGIGHEVAKRLLGDYNVIGTYFSSQEKLTDLQKEDGFTAFQLNLSETESIEKLSTFLHEKNILLHAIINCSGVILFENDKIDFSVWDKTIETNLTANYKIHKLLSKHISDRGSLVMISSTDARFGTPTALSYAVSKAGIDSLTKSLALAYKDRKVRVNSIAPGWIETEMMDQSGDELVAYAAGINPLKRNGTPEDIADLALYLISNEEGYVNGQIITIDGGYTNQDATLVFESEVLSAE